MKHPDMHRREFLKTAGLSAMALIVPQDLRHSLATPVSAHEGGRIGFILAALSVGGIDSAGVDHKLFLTRNGTFGKNSVEGGGSYIHFDPLHPVDGYPKDLLDTGTWRAEDLIKWPVPPSELIPYGTMYSGILDLWVRLFPEGGPHRGVRARMAVI